MELNMLNLNNTNMNFLKNLFSRRDSSSLSEYSSEGCETPAKSFEKLARIAAKNKYFKLSDLKRIPIGGQFSLLPIDIKSVLEGDDEAMLDILSQTERLKKYVPLLDFSNPNNSSKNFLKKQIMLTESGLGFSFGLRQNNCLCGAIIVDTPYYSKVTIGFEHWTISFFLFEPFENLGLMSAALLRTLAFLKEKIGVKNLYAIVDPGNIKSIHLLKKCLFEEISNDGWHEKSRNNTPIVFCCNLTTINFK